MASLEKSVLFTGMKHCGKSSTGRITAKALASDFHDMDDLLEDIYLAETGNRQSSREIYKKGREIFQSCELKAAMKLASTAETTAFISAAGGGFCDNSTAVDILKPAFVIIYIEETAEVLYDRIIRGGIPAFLSEKNPFDDFLKLYETRTEIYNNICNIKIRAEGRTENSISRECVLRLTEEDYAR